MSTKQSTKILKWKKAGFGLFIHYGLYSLCGGVWKGKPITLGYSEQILSHGKIPKEEYESLQKQFFCKKFDAEKICLLAKETSMTYIVMTAKHHDGFCLFNTKTTDYNSVKAPAGRDLIKEMSEACKKFRIGFGIYFSWIDWHFPYALPISIHNSDKIPAKHQRLNTAQLKELFTNYGKLCELWLDMGKPSKKQSLEIRQLAEKLQPGIMINGRIWNDMGDFCTMNDNQIPDKILNVPWQTPASIYHETWGYRAWQKRNKKKQKIEEIINSLLRVRASGGNYILNIGPKGCGSILKFEADILKSIGSFFKTRKLTQKNCLRLCKKRNLAVRENKNFKLKAGVNTIPANQKLYRFTGKDYYSSKLICTEVRTKIIVPLTLKGKSAEVYLTRVSPLKKAEKLMVNGKAFCYPAGKKDFLLFKNLKLATTLEFIVQTEGAAFTRKPLRQKNLFFTLSVKTGGKN